MTSGYAVRPIRPEDADELGQMHVQVWREAYAGLMPQESLDQLDPARSSARWRERAEVADQAEAGGEVTRIAQHLSSGKIVGFATVAPARDDEPPVSLELWAINVLAAHHGMGVADQLLTGALAGQDAYLWVVDGNERAQAFYRRHRFSLDGGTKRDDRLGVNEVRMVRDSAGPTES